MPRINFYVEVSETELANFLARVSGQDGRTVSHTVEEDEAEAPATDAPATDKNGVAWDARYHASSKALNADGTWRARKNMSDAEKAEADAYNKGGTVTSDVANIGAVGVEPVVTVDARQFVAAPALPVAAPVLPTMPGLPAAPAAPAPVSYEEVVALYTAAIGKNPSIDIAAMYAQAGVTDPNVLNTPEGAELRIKLAALLAAV